MKRTIVDGWDAEKALEEAMELGIRMPESRHLPHVDRFAAARSMPCFSPLDSR